MVAQVPQLLRNARTGSGEALSPFFLVRCLVSAFVHQRADPTTPAQAEWLLGDTCNLLGVRPWSAICLLAVESRDA